MFFRRIHANLFSSDATFWRRAFLALIGCHAWQHHQHCAYVYPPLEMFQPIRANVASFKFARAKNLETPQATPFHIILGLDSSRSSSPSANTRVSYNPLSSYLYFTIHITSKIFLSSKILKFLLEVFVMTFAQHDTWVNQPFVFYLLVWSCVIRINIDLQK